MGNRTCRVNGMVNFLARKNFKLCVMLRGIGSTFKLGQGGGH